MPIISIINKKLIALFQISFLKIIRTNPNFTAFRFEPGNCEVDEFSGTFHFTVQNFKTRSKLMRIYSNEKLKKKKH